MINLKNYIENKNRIYPKKEDIEWANSILFDNFTTEWCKKHSTHYYANNGYFPPENKKTNEKISVLNYLNLQNLKSATILDISTGAGQFLKLCKEKGHVVYGTEIERQLDSPISEIYNHYGISVTKLSVQANVKIELPNTYDVITSLRTQFNDLGTPWNSKNWIDFKENMFEYLNDNGTLFIKTNLKFQKRELGSKQEEIIKAFGDPILGWNSFTYCIKKV
jgi:cyclopropane fatty-acyl-phospholipid synthase-like methyltransferase